MLNERTLVNKLDRILKKEFGTNLAFREFSAGYGIADLVFAPNFSFRKKLIGHTPLTSFGTLQILLSLENDRMYVFDELLTLFPNFNEREIQKQLRLLQNNQYLTKVNDTYVRTVEQRFNPIKKIVAVEVKLSDHRGGLVQARRYQYFADESYLAILKSAEKNIDFNEFNRYNIGLILFDEDTNNIEIRQPQPTNQNYENAVSLYAKEMMVSRYLSVS